MNRKDRRAQEKAAEKAKAKMPSAIILSNPQINGNAEYEKQVGMKLKAEGKEAEAIPHLIKALELDSSFADVHFMLALMEKENPNSINLNKLNQSIKDKTPLVTAYKNILYIMKTRRQYRESLICQEQLCILLPDNLDEKANLGLTLNLLGQKEAGLRILAEVIDKDPDNHIYKSVFNGISGTVQFYQHEPLIKKALQRCFDNIYETNLVKSFALWANVILHDPDCSGLVTAERFLTYEDLEKWLNQASSTELNFMQERIFLDGLRLLTITSPIEEICLKRLRRWICLNSSRLASEGKLEFFEHFICALGEQCFFNEYIYSPSEEESSIIKNLIDKLLKDQEVGMHKIYAYALVSCFYPLIANFKEKIEDLRELSAKNTDFAKLVKTQLLDFIEEEKIKSELRSFGQLANEVSKTVRAQYEENPYPRWITVVKHPSPSDALPIPEDQRNNPWNVLVAGCGTGRHAINAIAAYPNGKITAIDLSRSSLAYAQRKAMEAGVADRVNFIHADILSMSEWKDKFDIIECSGVLHHMKDPFEGWQVLTNLLKPGGYFKVGLYSEKARKHVVEARDYVSEKQYPSTLDGIRECRDNIFKLPTNNPMRRWLVSTADFYATSLVRDLIFHVQEHRMSLPQIQEMMNKLGLVGKNFIVNDANTLKYYDQMFPKDYDRSSLENWDIFEQKFPDTFLGMYQFWSQKSQ